MINLVVNKTALRVTITASIKSKGMEKLKDTELNEKTVGIAEKINDQKNENKLSINLDQSESKHTVIYK